MFMSRIRWSFILFSYAGLFAYGMADSVRMPVFGEFLKELEISQASGSFFFALASAFAVLGSALCHRWIKRSGMDHAYLISLFLMSAGCLGFFISENLIQLLTSSMIFGFSMGTLGVMVNLYVSAGAPPEAQRKLFSGLHSMYGLSSFVAPLIVVGTQWMDISWRYSFIVVSIFLFLLGLTRWLIREKILITPRPQEVAVSLQNQSELRKEDLFLAGLLGWYVVAEILISSRLALYFQQSRGADLNAASTWLSLFFAGLLAGRFLGAFVHLPFSLRRILFFSNACTCALLLTGIFYHPLFLVLSGVSMSIFYPTAISYISTFTRSDLKKVMSVCLASQSLLTMVMHFSVGLLSDLLSLQWALLYGVFGILFSTLCLYFYERKLRSL